MLLSVRDGYEGEAATTYNIALQIAYVKLYGRLWTYVRNFSKFMTPTPVTGSLEQTNSSLNNLAARLHWQYHPLAPLKPAVWQPGLLPPVMSWLNIISSGR